MTAQALDPVSGLGRILGVGARLALDTAGGAVFLTLVGKMPLGEGLQAFFSAPRSSAGPT